jgi:hypothetical protein
MCVLLCCVVPVYVCVRPVFPRAPMECLLVPASRCPYVGTTVARAQLSRFNLAITLQHAFLYPDNVCVCVCAHVRVGVCSCE